MKHTRTTLCMLTRSMWSRRDFLNNLNRVKNNLIPKFSNNQVRKYIQQQNEVDSTKPSYNELTISLIYIYDCLFTETPKDIIKV